MHIVFVSLYFINIFGDYKLKLNILNEHLKKVEELDIFKNSTYFPSRTYDNVSDIDKDYEAIFNSLDYGIGVYSPTTDLDDFYISFLNKAALNIIPCDLDDIRYALVSDSLLNFSKSKIVHDGMKNVYLTGTPKHLYFEYYHGNLIFKRLKIQIFKANEFIYIIGKDESDYNFINEKRNQFFEDYTEAIAIIQDNRIIKCNKEYLKLHGHNSYDEVIGKKISYNGLNKELSSIISKTIDKILKQKSFSSSLPFEIEQKNKLVYYFNLNFNYIMYDNKPAIMVIFNDITEQELNRRKIIENKKEDEFLHDTINFIQNITNTGISYTVHGKYNYSSNFYEMLELKPSENDKYNNIIKDRVIDEDKQILVDNYKKFELNHQERDFIIRIKTFEGNLKYIQCYLMRNIKKDNDDTISYYKDVTEDQIYLNNLNDALDEAVKLRRSLNKIQKISKTATFYKSNKTIEWSPSTFDILKLDHKLYKNYKGNFLNYILDEDLHYLYEAYEKCSPTNPESTTTFRILNNDNEIVYIHTYIICDYDNQGNEIGFINFYEDITEQIIHEKKLKEALENAQRLEKNFEKIQKISKTTMLHLDKKTQEYTWYNKGYSILGFDSSTYKGNMSQYLIEADKNFWKEKHELCTPEHPEISFIQRVYSKGELKYIHTFTAYEFDDNGKKIENINLFQDITDEVKKANRLKKSINATMTLQDSLNRIQSASKTSIIYKRPSRYLISPELFEMLEVNAEDYKDNKTAVIENFIIDEDLKIREDNIKLLNPSHPEVSFINRIKTGKGNLKYIRTVIHQDYDNNGNFRNGISLNQDITEEITYQKQLENTLKDKNILLKEVHHRVKNNLQIILSLINLNIEFDVDTENTLLNTQNHLYAMALIHEKIYGSDSLSEVDMNSYIKSLVRAILDLYESDIEFHHDIDQINLPMEESIPLGLIINELVTNTIKYAFPNKRDGNIFIELKNVEDHYEFIYKDDGIGLPDDLDLDNISSLGLTVITSLTFQIDGNLSFLNCDGTGYKIEFKNI